MEKDIELTSKGIKKASEGEPIRNIDDVEKLKSHFRDKGKDGKLHKYYVFLIVGLNTALRVSDIVALKVQDLKGGVIKIKEKKTRKARQFKMNDYLKETLEKWIKQQNLQDDEYIFYSNMTKSGARSDGRENKTFDRKTQHIDKSVLYKAFSKAVKDLNLPIHYSNHCLRKTFAYHLYLKTKDLGLIQTLLNHSSTAVTLRYIGITQDVINDTMSEFML